MSLKAIYQNIDEKGLSNLPLKEMATAIRMLSVDMIEQAKSGHPGLPLGMADVAAVLWSRFLKFDPSNPNWFDRDRFILSGGHGSAMLYSLLYLTGFSDVTLDELKKFRQLGSRTAGHPEKSLVAGVDYSTGPLGQGLAASVGFALAERMMNARYQDDLVNHKTYVFCGDGDLMEGLSEEAIALAGHWKLNRLIVLWDNNCITIDGTTSVATSVNMHQRFEANNWRVLSCDGHDYESITKALTQAQQSDQPVLIDCKTIIGYGAPTKQGTPKVHGSPLGQEELQGLKEQLNWPYPAFEIPDQILDVWRSIGQKGSVEKEKWENRLAASSLKDKFQQTLEKGYDLIIKNVLGPYKEKLIQEKIAIATRKASQGVLDVLTQEIPSLIGGSADLAAACFTKTSVSDSVTATHYAGNYINYGIREHIMAAIMNGMAAHEGFIPYGGTFLSFVDYMKPAVRLASLMGLQEIFVLTHDSIGVGEDGPTHQPVEQLSGLRATPNLYVFRPADSIETTESYEMALRLKQAPSVLALSRQSLPVLRTDCSENKTALGGYVLFEPDQERKATLIATGSEVSLAMETQELLKQKGIPVAVVSMPCVELFAQQSEEYQKATLGLVPRIIVEAASSWGWDRFVGQKGTVWGIDSFGASGKGNDVMQHFGFTPDHIAELVLEEIKSV